MSEIETRHPDWKARYEFAMGQLGIDPRASDPARKNPRIKLSPPDNILLVHLGSLIGVLNDISIGGVSFHSNALTTVDREINLFFDLKYRGKLKLISSSLDTHLSSHGRSFYRIGARFLNGDEGYRCTVQSLRLISRSPRF